MTRREFDGVYMGTGTGPLYRVVEPPWWRVDRWARWFLTRERGRIETVWMGRRFSLRAVRARDLVLPNVPSEDATMLVEERMDAMSDAMARELAAHHDKRTRPS